MVARPDAPATRRNRDAILNVLQDELPAAGAVLEIGSGTGQHAVHFASHLPELSWQTSDVVSNHEGIRAWIDADGTGNVLPPIELDVLSAPPAGETYDAVFSANTAHIMGEEAVKSMFGVVGRCLAPGGVFCLYGPFNLRGAYTSESNAAFDRSLRLQDPAMGIRDLDWIETLAKDNSLALTRRYAMPANNMMLVFSKGKPL